ncbi:MAG: hypothetical protein H6855_03590 [Rhodospirillales bacterium]|nr:hypothetical protein [Rhodospirillales bacterium]MCB9979574.1 hypothetical protein [Rhodospirillales bacterium]
MNKFFTGLLMVSTTAALSACSYGFSQEDLREKGQYWQRTSVSSAVYLRGPKAQQVLNRDISTCVVELKELQRLGTIKEAFPAGLDQNGFPIDPQSPEGKMAKFDTPERDGSLIAEVFDYTDFETCMREKGWQRAEVLPRPTADDARGNYTKTILDPYKPQPKDPKALKNAGRVYND